MKSYDTFAIISKYRFRPTEIFNEKHSLPRWPLKTSEVLVFLDPNSRLSGQIGKTQLLLKQCWETYCILAMPIEERFVSLATSLHAFFFTLEQLGPFLMLFEHRIAKHYVAQTTCTKD